MIEIAHLDAHEQDKSRQAFRAIASLLGGHGAPGDCANTPNMTMELSFWRRLHAKYKPAQRGNYMGMRHQIMFYDPTTDSCEKALG